MPTMLGTRRVPYLSSVWTPRSLPGLVLWLDAATIGQADNTPVSLWRDRSGQGNDASQGTTAAQPTYLAGGINGHPSVRGDGVDDILQTANAPHFATWTVLAAVSLPLNRTTIIAACGVGVNLNWYLGNNSLDTSRAGYEDISAAYREVSGTLPAAGTPYVMGMRYDSATLTIYGNGVIKALVAYSVAPITVASSVISLFALSNSAQVCEANIGSVIVCQGVLSDALTQRANRYLGARYGIAVN